MHLLLIFPTDDGSSIIEYSSPIVQYPQCSIVADNAKRQHKLAKSLTEKCKVAYDMSFVEEIEGDLEPYNYSSAITSVDCNN